MFNNNLSELGIVNENDKLVGILDICDLRSLKCGNVKNLRENALKFAQSIDGNSIKSYIDQEKTVNEIFLYIGLRFIKAGCSNHL
jgi:hypothetical protein